MITFIGERAILSNLRNPSFKITDFAVGKGAQNLDKNIENLGEETVRKSPEINYNSKTNNLEFIISLNGSEMEGVNELGLFTKDNKLICYDTFKERANPKSSTIKLKYTLNLYTEHLVQNWTEIHEMDNCYETRFSFNVLGVMEQGTRSGYVRKPNLKDILTTVASYHYNPNTNKLSIHCIGGANPNVLSILVRSE